MKYRIVALLAFLLCPLSLLAQMPLRQSTATQVEILAMSSAGLLWTNTGSNANITISLTKAADTAIPAYSEWVPTTRGGGTHDADVTAVGKSTWTVELTATDVNTLGRTQVCFRQPVQSVNFCQAFIVQAANSYDANHIGDLAVDVLTASATGTADSGTTTTMVDAGRTEADTDYFAGSIIRFVSGNISGQSRLITAFNAATDTITFTPATTQAVTTQNYEILPASAQPLSTIIKNVASQQLGIWFKTSAGANATGISTANITCTISKDFGAPATTNDTTEAEVGNGVYYIDITQTESNANWIALNCNDASGVGLPYSALITTQH